MGEWALRVNSAIYYWLRMAERMQKVAGERVLGVISLERHPQ